MLKISNRFPTVAYLKTQFREDPYQTFLEVIFSFLTFLGLLSVLLILILSLLVLIEGALPIFNRYGLSNIVSISFQNNQLNISFPSHWNLNASSELSNIGVAVFVAGTIVTSVLAILLAFPLSVGSAVYINEYAPKDIKKPLSVMFQLIASIPSVVFGLWAFIFFGDFVNQYLVPIMTILNVQNSWVVVLLGTIIAGYFILKTFISITTKKTSLKVGIGRILLILGSYVFLLYIIQIIITLPYSAKITSNVLLAILVLTIMITPFVAALSQEIFAAVPISQKEAAYALGSTPWETVRLSVLPVSK